VEGSPPWAPLEAELGAAASDEAAAAGSAEEEARPLERAAMEGMDVHLCVSSTIRKVSTAVPTA